MNLKPDNVYEQLARSTARSYGDSARDVLLRHLRNETPGSFSHSFYKAALKAFDHLKSKGEL